MSVAPLSDQERAWWIRPEDYLEDEDERAHLKLRRVIDAIERDQDYRKRASLVHYCMYGGVTMAGRAAESSVRTEPGADSTLSLNVTRSVVDAVTSRVYAKSRPHLSYVTEGGDYEKQHNAEKLERGVEGVFYTTNFYDRAVEAARLGTIAGTGILRIEPNLRAGAVEVRKLYDWQVIVDDAESFEDGEPRSYFIRTPVDKYVLAEEYRDDEEKRRKILALSGERDDDAELGLQRGFRLRVDEGWHRPSGPGASDGRYVKAVGNCTLIDRPWDGGRRSMPNIAVYRWSNPIVGWYGTGLVEQGRGIQREINQLVRRIQQGHHLITGRWLVEASSKIVAAHIQNDLASILRYSHTPPTYVAPTIISPEVYQHLWNLVQRYYEIAAGVSMQAAAAQKPAGLDSGEAQRVYADQQTETLLERGQRFESFVRECGQLVTDAARELARDGGFEVRAMSDDAFETIDWKELDDPDGYELRVSPTSSLPGTPSGKIDLAYDLMKLGQFDTADVMEIIGMPDMLQKTSLKMASRTLVEKKVGEMIRLSKPYAPSPFLNFDEAMSIARDMYNLAESKDVPDDRLQLVRDFMEAIQAQKAKASAPPPQPMAPGAPGVMQPGSPGAAPAAPGAPPLPAVPAAA